MPSFFLQSDYRWHYWLGRFVVVAHGQVFMKSFTAKFQHGGIILRLIVIIYTFFVKYIALQLAPSPNGFVDFEPE